MKTLIAGLLLLSTMSFTARADEGEGKENRHKHRAAHEKCLKDNGVTDAQIAALHACHKEHKQKGGECLASAGLTQDVQDKVKENCRPHHPKE